MKKLIIIAIVTVGVSCTPLRNSVDVDNKFDKAEQYFDYLHSNNCKTDSIRRELLTY